VNIGLNDTLCDGFTKTLDAGTGFVSYLWSNGLTTQTNVFGSTGDYWVEVEDANGCSASDTMHLEINLAPVLNLGPNDSICASQGYNLNAGNPGNSIVSYLWSTGSVNQSISIVADPTIIADVVVDYSVTITDVDGCVNADTLTLSTFILPLPILGNDTSFCIGAAFSLVLNPGTFDTYAWSNGSTASTITVGASANTYTVTVTDLIGCSNTDATTVTQNALPVPNLGADATYCQGASFTKILNAGIYDAYLWSDGSSGQILGVSSAGTFGITVTDANGCENNDEIIITENPTPMVDLGADATYCEDEMVGHFLDATTLLPTNNYDFLWSTTENTGFITATNFGTFWVVVTDQNTGCDAKSEMDIIAMEKAQPDLGNDGVVCQGQLVLLDPLVTIPGYNYIWSNGATSSTINIFETGLYWVRLDAADGSCTGLTDSVYFSPGVLPVVNLGGDQNVCEGQSVILLNGTSPFPESTYQWQDGYKGNTYVATKTGSYEVEVTNGCGSVVDQVYLEFQDCSNVYVPTSFTPNGDGRNEIFYPSTDQEFTEYGFWIYDRWGSRLFKTNEPNVGWDGKVNGTIMQPGTYVWRISYVSSFEENGIRIEKTSDFQLLR
jgi:gliding motility-associated-like protein